MSIKPIPCILLLVVMTHVGVTYGQEQVTEKTDDLTQVEAAIKSYMAAFNARDVEALVGHWSPQGVFVSRDSGEQVVGRESMREEFATMFAGEGAPKLAVETESIEFISPNVALERGTATVTHSADDIVESQYRVIYLKSGDAWLIDRITDDEVEVAANHHERLKDLEWIIGDWIDEGDGFAIELTGQWTKNRNYISRTFKVSRGDQITSSGLQVIGWDPNRNEIRSWLFDSDGGFVSGTWAQREDRWIVSSVATLAGGGSGSFTSIFRPLEDGTYGWQKTNRIVDGELLPHTDETIVRRK